MFTILWDNDGVLVDTEKLFFEATRRAFAQLGLVLTPQHWGVQYLSEGKHSRDVALALGAPPERIAPVLEERNRQYQQMLAPSPPLRPRVRETLAALFGRVRMGIVTGCRREQLRFIHASNGWLTNFEVIVAADDCANSKPHPEAYLKATEALGVKPAHCLAVEDSPRGLASARVAGIPCIVVPHELTQGLEFPGALAIEPDVSAVLKHFEASQRDKTITDKII